MKIFFVGDFVKDTGPGMANKMVRKGLSSYKNISYSDATNKISRVFEIIYKTAKSDCICFCSPSRANIIGLRIAKFFKKRSFYLMHGYLTYEYKINNNEIIQHVLTEINSFEKYIFNNVEKVFCVSKRFMEYMEELEPDFKEKFDYIYNGVNLEEIEKSLEKNKRNKKVNQIVSIGGGMAQKNNLTVCKAIEKLRNEKGMDLYYVVIGLPFTDKEKICSYDFVTYYDQLPHNDVIKILSESYLYVQNSIFETYGIATIEALTAECNLLISNNIGSIDVIKTLNDTDIIYDTYDEEEIAGKIEKIIKSGNAQRLKMGINRDDILYSKTSVSLINKLSAYMGDSIE